ncbi:RsmE family RNA methyltransferase [Helicobacter typhlonius]|uniref:16S rRNA (uracil(1498)-N(3))-methyltransferase n=1 Tax=Helicobacter typhlonius TaxID=76936 RepID=UPI002FDFDE03
MQFLYHQNAGESPLTLSDETFHYLFKVRRIAPNEHIKMRNLRDKNLYIYAIAQVQKKSALIEIVGLESTNPADSKHSNEEDFTLSNTTQDFRASVSQSPALHLLWAIIEPKVIEKTLPFLNELDVARISFFYAQFSQRQFAPSLERLNKILIQSCQQCGRTNLMDLEIFKSFDEVCTAYTPFYAFDFGGEDIRAFMPYRESTQSNATRDLESTRLKFAQDSKIIPQDSQTLRIMVGAEGGFSDAERARFDKIVSLKEGAILRSESACVFLASIAKLWQKP